MFSVLMQLPCHEKMHFNSSIRRRISHNSQTPYATYIYTFMLLTFTLLCYLHLYLPRLLSYRKKGHVRQLGLICVPARV